MKLRSPLRILLPVLLAGVLVGESTGTKTPDAGDTYRLGPDDQVSIRVADLDKLQLEGAAAPKVDLNGNLNLPIIGHIHASNLTVVELEGVVRSRLSNILQNPQVSASVVQYRSHPVSVLGAVRNPGVLQVTQHKKLLEVLSLAGGLSTDAGDRLKISRQKAEGELPLHNVMVDPSSPYVVGTLDVKSLMEANHPEYNIEILDNDVITVPKAELVYVIGAVKKSGGFTLGEHEQISVLQAISLAEGLMPSAATNSARLLRNAGPGKDRQEIAVQLKPIMKGDAPDVPLHANDILFIPTSATKVITMRGIETAVSLGTGMAIFH